MTLEYEKGRTSTFVCSGTEVEINVLPSEWTEVRRVEGSELETFLLSAMGGTHTSIVRVIGMFSW